jgi:hypothetical protein
MKIYSTLQKVASILNEKKIHEAFYSITVNPRENRIKLQGENSPKVLKKLMEWAGESGQTLEFVISPSSGFTDTTIVFGEDVQISITLT